MEVEIGDNESTTSEHRFPICMYYNYSLTQQIYTADEIGTVGTISSISFDYVNTADFSCEGVQVYMKNVAKEEFDSNTDIVAISSSDLVWEGTFQADGAGWVTINLDTPFAYDGTSNLLVCFYDPTDGYPGSAFKFRTTTSPSYLGIAYFSDSYVPDLSDLSTYGGSKYRYSYRANIKLDITPTGVFYAKPTNLEVSDLTAHTATVSWTAPEGSPTGYAYQYKKTSDTEWSAETTVTSPSVPLSGLTAETAYNFQVKAKYSGGESGYAAINFTTPVACPAPTDLKATLTPGNGTVATLSWTENGTATNWVLEYGTDSEFSGATSVNVSGTPTKDFTGLTPETTYYARVKATQGGDESAWSKTVSFTPTNDYSVLVNDGTATNNYVPIYGYYCDYSLVSSQFIIPANDLAAMQYGTINNLIFYTSQSDIDWGVAEFEVYMTEVPETTFSSATLLDWNGMEKVMNAGTLAVSGNNMVVTLDAPYQYMGGNLMIGFKQTVKGSEGTSTWYGVSTENSETPAIGGASSVSAIHFKPKTTINYTPGTAPSVLKPTNLAVNYTGGKTAEVSWTSTESGFDIDVNGTVTQNVTNPYTLTGLDLSTTYEVKVRAKNSSGVSDWTNPVSFKTDDCENPIVVNYNLADSYGDGWNGNKIQIVDNEGVVIDEVTIESGASAIGTLRLCGDYLEFVWYKGTYPGECSWTFTDVNGNVLFSGQGDTSMQTGDVLHVIDNGACPRPTDLAVSEIGPRSVKLSWTENGTANKWKICFIDGGDNITEVVTANSNPFTLTGLTPETDYTVRIIAVNGSDESALSERISFTTAIANPAPTDLAVTHVGPTNATVSWSSFSSSNELRYVANPNYANQGYVTNLGAMANGADASWIQGSQSLWGAGANYSNNSFVADDFTIYSATTLKEIEVYGYQTGSTTSSTFTGLYAQIYDGNPADGGNLVWGDDNNIMSSTSFTNCYRGSNDTPTETTRPIMAITASGLDINLAPGTYWLVYSLTGSGSSGPWVVPYSEPSVGNTGEGWQYANSAWATLIDDGSNTPYGCAMKLTFEEDIESLAWTTITDINANEYNLTGLDPETFYLVQVRSNYGSDGVSNWTTLGFTTTDMNPTPTDVEADLMADGATLTWTGYGDSYNVRYRTAASTETFFYEDFENGMSGWTAIRNSDGTENTDWHVVNSNTVFSNGSIPAHSGNNVAMSRSYAGSAYSVDNWLITPQVTFGNTLQFWVMDDGQYHEHYDVYISTTGNNIDDFILLDSPGDASSTWTEVSVDLSSYAGQQGYIAIRNTDNDQDFLFIDDFGIYGDATPAGSWTTTTTSDATITLTELPTNTAYEYQIQSVRGGSTSEWTDIQSFALLTLQEDADNTSLIADNVGRKAHVTLADHTLYKAVHYSTMCLPFDLKIDESPLADAMIRVLDDANSSFDAATNTLNVTFKSFTDDVIPAGTPFVAIWLYGSNLTNPEFANVIMGSNAGTVAFTGGSFLGNFSPVTLTENDMYFGPDKTLSWPSTNVTIGSFRGRLQLENPQLNQPIDITINLMPGMVLTLRYLKGDANGDDSVSITDAVAVVNYILGTPSADFNRMNANVNGDADTSGNPNITITDAVGIVNIILNSTSTAPEFELEEVDTEVEPE